MHINVFGEASLGLRGRKLVIVLVSLSDMKLNNLVHLVAIM